VIWARRWSSEVDGRMATVAPQGEVLVLTFSK
jgi:hypothetical protein